MNTLLFFTASLVVTFAFLGLLSLLGTIPWWAGALVGTLCALIVREVEKDMSR